VGNRVVTKDLGLFSVGFSISAIGVTWAASQVIGLVVETHLPAETRLFIAVGLCTCLCIQDLWRLNNRKTCRASVSRQTPSHWGRSSAGVLCWGIDTGLVLTTFRTTLLPVMALLLCALGFGSAWSGAAYALGFLAILWCNCRIPPTARALDQVADLHATFSRLAAGSWRVRVLGAWISASVATGLAGLMVLVAW
jgi:hypothetical protein